MSIRRWMSVAAGAVLALVVAAPAMAHVTVAPGEAEAGGYAVLTFTVPHDCDGSPTTGIDVSIPAGIGTVRAEAVPGWDLSYEIGELPEPVGEGDEAVTEGVTVVSWHGGPLPGDQIQRFYMQVRLPDAAGETLWFPTVQSCEDGEIAWINIPAEGEDAHDLEDPAPGVTLTAAGDHGGHGGGDDDAAVDDGSEDGAVNGDAEEAAAPADGEATASVETGDGGDGGTDALTWVALVLGVLGLGAGGFALARTRTG